MLPYQTLPSSGHVSHGCFCFTPSFYFFLFFFHLNTSTGPKARAGQTLLLWVWHRRAALRVGHSLLLTHRNRIWLVLFLLPRRKGMGQPGASAFTTQTPSCGHRERAHHQCRLRAEQPLGLALNTAHLHALPLPTQNFSQQAQNHPVAPLEFPAGSPQPLVQTLPARSCTPPIQALLQNPATMSNC